MVYASRNRSKARPSKFSEWSLASDETAIACQTALALYFSGMNQRLQIDPNICHGKPVIRGTRVLVSTILGALSGGDTVESLLEDYPNITRQDVEAALEFASRLSDYQELSYEAVA